MRQTLLVQQLSNALPADAERPGNLRLRDSFLAGIPKGRSEVLSRSRELPFEAVHLVTGSKDAGQGTLHGKG